MFASGTKKTDYSPIDTRFKKTCTGSIEPNVSYQRLYEMDNGNDNDNLLIDSKQKLLAAYLEGQILDNRTIVFINR